MFSEEELGFVKFATRASFISIACLLAAEKRPLRFKDLERKASTAMLQLFLEFGLKAGLLETVPLLERGKHYNAYRLSADGEGFYHPFIAWDRKLKSKFNSKR